MLWLLLLLLLIVRGLGNGCSIRGHHLLMLILLLLLLLGWPVSGATLVLNVPPASVLEVNGRVSQCAIESILLHIEVFATIGVILDDDNRVGLLGCFCGTKKARNGQFGGFVFLSWMDHQCHVYIVLCCKLSELFNGNVLHFELIPGRLLLVPRDHELHVVQNNVLHVVHVYCIFHGVQYFVDVGSSVKLHEIQGKVFEPVCERLKVFPCIGVGADRQRIPRELLEELVEQPRVFDLETSPEDVLALFCHVQGHLAQKCRLPTSCWACQDRHFSPAKAFDELGELGQARYRGARVELRFQKFLEDVVSQVCKGDDPIVGHQLRLVDAPCHVHGALEQGIVGVLGVRTVHQVGPVDPQLLGKLFRSLLAGLVRVHPQDDPVESFQEGQDLQREAPAAVGEADGRQSGGLVDRHGVVLALRHDDGGAVGRDGVEAKEAPSTARGIEALPRLALEGPSLDPTGHKGSGRGSVGGNRIDIRIGIRFCLLRGSAGFGHELGFCFGASGRRSGGGLELKDGATQGFLYPDFALAHDPGKGDALGLLVSPSLGRETVGRASHAVLSERLEGQAPDLREVPECVVGRVGVFWFVLAWLLAAGRLLDSVVVFVVLFVLVGLDVIQQS
mmetsp:Transcript_21357/g.59400  ORF Transcript_21357/g.59400 Transcript_21357/m.59400 type:complete len:618 (+) Transcript_21357:2624-4477(+)